MKTVKRTNDECEVAMTKSLKTAVVVESRGRRGDRVEAVGGLQVHLGQIPAVHRPGPCRREVRDAQNCCPDSPRTDAG